MDLIQRSQSGDEEAFAALFHQYKNLVYKTAYLLLGDAHEAEDVLQEVFIRIYRSLQTFQPEKGSFTKWLHRVTVNQCLNWRRKRRLSFSSLEEIPGLDPKGSAPPSPENMELTEGIQRMVSNLKPKQRAVVVLRYYWGYSYDEISQILGIPLGTVKSRLWKALRTMRKELELELGARPRAQTQTKERKEVIL